MKNSIHAIDTLFKVYKVIGIKVPVELIMINDFLCCVLYKIISQSSRATVNRIAASFKEAAKAENVQLM